MLIATLSALMGLAALAQAGGNSGVSVELENNSVGVYEGSLDAEKNSRCNGGRRVVVYHDEDDDGVDSSDFKIGSATSKRSGDFRVEGPQAPPGDTVIAVAKRKKLGHRKHKVTCFEGEGSTKALSAP
jgi:hypothetical protein